MRARARRELAEAHAELDARREQEEALREHLELLAAEVTVGEHRRVELHVAYVELLTHARATAAAAARGELAPAAYVAGHLEEIGLQPAPGAVPDQVVAEGLIIAIGLQAGSDAASRDGGSHCAPHSAAPHTSAECPAAKASGRAGRRAAAREGSDVDRTPQPHGGTRSSTPGAGSC